MARKRTLVKPGKIVQFKLENRTYQIDPDLRKVYKAFVEIETSRAAEILTLWRSSAGAI
jgi:hypothetical protein